MVSGKSPLYFNGTIAVCLISDETLVRVAVRVISLDVREGLVVILIDPRTANKKVD